eukprot:COSAG06_NODE_2465_length_6822_cov_6.403540_5_plen_203_part_00
MSSGRLAFAGDVQMMSVDGRVLSTATVGEMPGDVHVQLSTEVETEFGGTITGVISRSMDGSISRSPADFAPFLPIAMWSSDSSGNSDLYNSQQLLGGCATDHSDHVYLLFLLPEVSFTGHEDSQHYVDLCHAAGLQPMVSGWNEVPDHCDEWGCLQGPAAWSDTFDCIRVSNGCIRHTIRPAVRIGRTAILVVQGRVVRRCP